MNKNPSPLLDRGSQKARNRWSDIGTNPKQQDDLKWEPDLSEQDLQELVRLVDQSLQARGGEVSARQTAARIGRAYMTLHRQGRERFFRLLATRYDVIDSAVSQAIADYQQAGPDGDLPKLRHKLRNALLPSRVKLLTLFNALPEGIKFLVDMRADIIALDSENDRDLRKVERDLKHLLASWFDVGFLKLQQITWESPASLLEKLIAYEAVHEIASWDDLKHRLAEDRRLFAFFHPNMPNEPLIFIHCAIGHGLATNVQKLLDTDAAPASLHDADTAIFYSISNAQSGLAGIGFGNFLIKRVVSEVRKELPQLRQFATLSPIPGFKNWLEKQLAQTRDGFLHADEQKVIERIALTIPTENCLQAVLSSNDWHRNEVACRAIEPVVKRLCAIYLSSPHSKQTRLLDPVAHFHSSNGATIKQLNWLGNTSAAGLAQSHGMMVNYLYELDQIDQNSERYATSHQANLSNEIRQLIDGNCN